VAPSALEIITSVAPCVSPKHEILVRRGSRHRQFRLTLSVRAARNVAEYFVSRSMIKNRVCRRNGSSASVMIARYLHHPCFVRMSGDARNVHCPTYLSTVRADRQRTGVSEVRDPGQLGRDREVVERAPDIEVTPLLEEPLWCVVSNVELTRAVAVHARHDGAPLTVARRHAAFRSVSRRSSDDRQC
jgi:hypothetical protein